MAVNPCIVIPCFDHASTVTAVAGAAGEFCPVIIVDDGSARPLAAPPGCRVLRWERNLGKGAALSAGFKLAAELDFTHVVTMDADGQHFASDLPKILEAAIAKPNALIVGVRDFYAANCPIHRRQANALSTFWFRVETGVRLGDSQCGFRCYPISLAQQMKVRSGRFAFESEIMVRASWAGAEIVAIPVKCSYEPHQLRQSHFRPVRDLAHIAFMNFGLVAQSWMKHRPALVEQHAGEERSPWKNAWRVLRGKRA